LIAKLKSLKVLIYFFKEIYYLLAFLKYVYCDEVDLIEELVYDLLILSNKWLKKNLEEEGEEFLIDILVFENVVKIAKLANQLELEELTKVIFEFVIENRVDRGNLSNLPHKFF